MELSELSVALRQKQDQWWQALTGRELVWAAYYANDLEAIARQITSLTHKEVERHYADPKSALGRHQGSPKPPTQGDRG